MHDTGLHCQTYTVVGNVYGKIMSCVGCKPQKFFTVSCCTFSFTIKYYLDIACKFKIICVSHVQWNIVLSLAALMWISHIRILMETKVCQFLLLPLNCTICLWSFKENMVYMTYFITVFCKQSCNDLCAKDDHTLTLFMVYRNNCTLQIFRQAIYTIWLEILLCY